MYNFNIFYATWFTAATFWIAFNFVRHFNFFYKLFDFIKHE